MSELITRAASAARIALFAASVALIVSCGGPPGARGSDKDNADYVRKEFLKAEKSGTPMGDLYAALRETQPDLYAGLIEKAGAGLADGKTPFEAGATMRPAFQKRFMQLMATASDENTADMLEFGVEQAEHAQAIDPQLCVNVLNGKADLRITSFPKQMQDHELRLMAKVLRAGDQKSAAATREELAAWIQKLDASRPDIMKGLALMGEPALSAEKAKAVCAANIDMVKLIDKEPPQTRALLFRGLLKAGS